MNFVLSDLDQIFVKIQHLNQTDEEAEVLLDAAVQKAGIEIRTYARQLRQTEKDLQAHRAACTAEQNRIARGELDRLAREKITAKARQADLAAAEAQNGPRRGHWYS